MLRLVRASVSAAWNRVAVQRALKVSALVVLFAAGALLAGKVVAGGRAAQTETTTTTATETTTAPGTTEVTTVERTTTRRVFVPTATTSPTSSENGTPAWVWVLLGLLALGLIVLALLLVARRGGGGGGAVPPEERRRRLDGAVVSWAAQGWALENQSADSAVLVRGPERMLVSVDPAGHVSTQPLSAQ